MTTGTDNISNGSDVYIAKIGIQGSHAYSLLSAIELYENYGRYSFQPNGGSKIRLVLIRNPWGQKEWKGDWGDSDQRWNDSELRKLLQHNLEDDGKFFIEWNDFKKYYSDF